MAAFDGVDAVLHLAAAVTGNEDTQFASTVVATERFLDAMAKSAVKRLVHVSSLVVYDWSKARSCMDEETPLEDNPYAMGGYTICQDMAGARCFTFCRGVIPGSHDRSPGIYLGDWTMRKLPEWEGNLVKLYLLFGPFTRLPLSYVDNCADCLVTAVENPAASGEIFNIIDGDEVRVWQYAREYARRIRSTRLFASVALSRGTWLGPTGRFHQPEAVWEKRKTAVPADAASF